MNLIIDSFISVLLGKFIIMYSLYISTGTMQNVARKNKIAALPELDEASLDPEIKDDPVQTTTPLQPAMSLQALALDSSKITEEVDVDTQYGKIHCTVKGVTNINRPVILTYHDIGLNHKTCFDGLFSHEDMREIVRRFAIIHVDAPGQHDGAATLSTGYTFPSLDQLSDTLLQVLKHFGLKSFIGMGMGAGAYILARFALNYPDMVDGLTLINANMKAETLMDTVTQKITGWTHSLPDMVISHLFGKEEIQSKQDLIETYRHVIEQVNQANLHHFVKSYNSRRGLELGRPVAGGNLNVRSLRCHTLMVVGDQSPAVEAVVDCNAKLNPTKTTLLKMADCGGLPQEDQPGKLTEAFKYFIQGMGYMSSSSMTRLVRSRTASGSSISSMDSARSRSLAVEGRARAASGTEEQRGRSHTDVSMESVSNMAEQTAKKSTGLVC